MRQVIADLPASRIREVANAGMGRKDVLAFWFGESDEITPVEVREAAATSLASGETFYAHNLGLPALREAIAAYASSLHGPIDVNRIAVTSSGVNALMLAQQALVDAGDEVLVIVPVWPNLTAQPAIMGAKVSTFALKPGVLGWTLDVPALLACITAATKVLVLNAPNNPTGWTLTRDEQIAILAHCRQTGTWIVSDEVYERLYFPVDPPTVRADGRVAPICAPSFLDIATPDDRLVVVHSFSKSFLMTGWRLGNLVAPVALMAQLGKLIEFNTSCAPVFVQQAGVAALAAQEQIVPRLQSHLRLCRNTLAVALSGIDRVEAATPLGAMYLFLRVAGESDSLALAKRLVADHGLGLAPGSAFGPEGEGWLRWCFASRDPQRLVQGADRLRAALAL